MIIDYFPFFNEAELLELRINLLKNHVDHFVICEADHTFSGLPKPFLVPDLIKQLGLPQDQITISPANILKIATILIASKAQLVIVRSAMDC